MRPANGRVIVREVHMITSRRLRSRATAMVVSLGVAGGLALAAAPMANASVTPPSSDICDLGYVWRQVVPTDHVCVTPATRSQAWYDNSQAASRVNPAGAYGPNTCIQGYVWREAVPGDFVCVTPDIRAQAASDNSQAASRAIGNGIRPGRDRGRRHGHQHGGRRPDRCGPADRHGSRAP